jgi:hypothetical protein
MIDMGDIDEETGKQILDAYKEYRPSIWESIGDLLGITPDQAKALTLVVGGLFLLGFVKSLLR